MAPEPAELQLSRCNSVDNAGLLSDFSRPEWDHTLLVISVRSKDDHLKIIVDSLQRGSFAIFEFVDPATRFVVTSLTHRGSGHRVRLFASLASAAEAAELAEQCGDWAAITPETVGNEVELWARTKEAWLRAGFEQATRYPSPDAADSLPTWGRIGEHPRLVPDNREAIGTSGDHSEGVEPYSAADLFSPFSGQVRAKSKSWKRLFHFWSTIGQLGWPIRLIPLSRRSRPF